MRRSSNRLSIEPASPELVDGVAARAHPDHAFLRQAWFEAAAPTGLTMLGVKREDGTPIAALPRVSRRIGLAAIAEVPGSYWPFRSFPIAADITDAELVAMQADPRFRSHFGFLWRMGPVYADDPTATRLVETARKGGWIVLERRLGTIYELDLAEPSANAGWRGAAALRKNRSRERKLAEVGDVDWRFMTGAEWTKGDLDGLAKVEEKSWVGDAEEGGDPKFADPARRRVWERLAADPVIAAMLFCGLLLVGGDPAAFSFGLEVGVVRFHIGTAYDKRYSKFGPGKLILSRNFDRAAAKGIRRISWGAGDAGYKREMGAHEGPGVVDLLFVRSRLLAALLRPIWKR